MFLLNPSIVLHLHAGLRSFYFLYLWVIFLCRFNDGKVRISRGDNQIIFVHTRTNA